MLTSHVSLSRILATSLFGGGVLGLSMAFAWDTPPLVRGVEVFWALSIGVSLVVGLVLALRVKDNVFGWLMIIGAGLVCWGIAFDEVNRLDLAEGFFSIGIVVLMSALIVFPTGRHINEYWKWAHLTALLTVFTIGRINPDQDGLGILLLFLLTVGALIARLIRGASIERRQVGLPVFMLMMGFSLAIVQVLVFPGGDLMPIFTSSIVTLGFPLAVGASILRYRLYDLDRLISRTVGYALIVGLLAVLYSVGAVWLPSQLPGDSPGFVAGSTLAVAAMFAPLRRRILSIVDRRFYRSRYDAMRVVEEFSSRLRDQVDLELLTRNLLSVVNQTMHPSSAALWVRKT